MLFNDVIHSIRHLVFQVRHCAYSLGRMPCAPGPLVHVQRQEAWPSAAGSGIYSIDLHILCWDLLQETPVEATHWGRWARHLPLPAEFAVLVAPPLVGGLVVGSLRALTQFDKPGVAAGSSPPSASNPLKVHIMLTHPASLTHAGAHLIP